MRGMKGSSTSLADPVNTWRATYVIRVLILIRLLEGQEGSKGVGDDVLHSRGALFLHSLLLYLRSRIRFFNMGKNSRPGFASKFTVPCP